MAKREQEWKRHRIGGSDRDRGRNRTGEGDLVAETEQEREIVWQKKNRRGKDRGRKRGRNRKTEAYSE